jgi:hypothetical protein
VPVFVDVRLFIVESLLVKSLLLELLLDNDDDDEEDEDDDKDDELPMVIGDLSSSFISSLSAQI